ncbi:MAG: hypothetical protein FD167_3439 [bacterium]|nr:MAG: hypothetical protein FD167_3439 [bacterium]
MAKNIITATDVRNDFFNLINLVAKTKEPIYIKKDNEVMVKLEPVGDEINAEWERTKRILDETRGMWAHRSEKEIRARFRKADLASTKKIRARKW